MEPCSLCGQMDIGQTGEHPCAKCGLPVTWDIEILCTWKDCTSRAAIPQIDRSGATWAKLCVAHDAELTQAIDSRKPAKIMSSWIKAHGGAKEMD